MPEKIVLAYSGGLDTSIIIPWLKDNFSCNVIAMVGDVGQGDDIEAVVEKAYATGARQASGRGCAARGRDRGGARLHGKRKRSSSL